MKSKKIKLMVGALLVTMVGAVFTGCGSSDSKDSGEGNADSNKQVTISISGSTSVGPLMEKIQEVYEAENPNVTLEIQQPGSGTGIKNAMEGVVEIGMASRELKAEESGVEATVIAYDGIALLVNPKNKVKDITMQQIKDIYTGKITNWKEVGGSDAPIVVVSREEGSGTRDAFQELVGYKAEELVKDASISDGSGAVKATVAGNENAIGFASFEYVDNTVAALKVDGAEPTAENVKGGSYKISRPFNLITKEDTLTEDGKALIDFIKSDKGQEIVAENKLITLK